MKKNISKAILVLLGAMMSTTSVYAYSDKDSLQLESTIANDIINSKDIFTIDSSSDFYKNFNGKLYVKLRDVTEFYGYNVDWNNTNKSGKVYKDENYLEFKVGSTMYSINGSVMNIIEEPIIYDSSVFIPYEMYKRFFEKEVKNYDVEKYSIISDEIFVTMDNLYTEQLIANEEYRKAFLETGGKIEEYKPPTLMVGYNVISSSDIISINIYRYQSLASSYTEDIYLNYNGKNLEKISLEEVLGSGYETTLKNEIRAMMKKREELEPEKYNYDYEAYDNIVFDESTSFYFDEKGNLVITFDKYEIAAGAFGRQYFTLGTEGMLSESKIMFNNLNNYISNNKSEYITYRGEIIKGYLPKYFKDAEKDLVGLSDLETLQLFGMPEFISMNYEEDKKVFIYRTEAFDSSACYIIFEDENVVNYKIDDFNGEFLW